MLDLGEWADPKLEAVQRRVSTCYTADELIARTTSVPSSRSVLCQGGGPGSLPHVDSPPPAMHQLASRLPHPRKYASTPPAFAGRRGTRQAKSTPRRWREFAPRSRSGDLSLLNHTNGGSAT